MLAIGYVSCAVNDAAGLTLGRSTLGDLGLATEQATLVSFAAASYLCPEYFSEIFQNSG